MPASQLFLATCLVKFRVECISIDVSYFKGYSTQRNNSKKVIDLLRNYLQTCFRHDFHFSCQRSSSTLLFLTTLCCG